MNDRIGRVVIPLDTAAEGGTAIETAARLAARANAPLHGIFVEDEDLLNLANLPFCPPAHARGGYRAADRRAGRAATACGSRTCPTGYRRSRRAPHRCLFIRGCAWLVAERLSGVSEDDLVVASALSRPIAGQFRLESRWWSSINTAPGPLLMTRRAWETGGAVLMMVRDQSQGSVRLLKAAARIAEARETNLTLVCGADLAGAKEIEGWAMGHLVQHSVPLQVERAPVEPVALRKRMLELDCGVLAIEAGLVEAGPDRIRELAKHLACDLLVVC